LRAENTIDKPMKNLDYTIEWGAFTRINKSISKLTNEGEEQNDPTHKKN